MQLVVCCTLCVHIIGWLVEVRAAAAGWMWLAAACYVYTSLVLVVAWHVLRLGCAGVVVLVWVVLGNLQCTQIRAVES